MSGISGMGSASSALSIMVLLPDILGTYSDAGNAVVLAERACRRGIPAEVRMVGFGDVPPRTADLYVIGGGEDTAQLSAAAWLARHRLRDELADRAVVLAVCAGFQLLGTSMTDRAGRTHPGVGVLDVATTPGARRAVGEIATTATVAGIGRLTGFENHLGRTRLGTGVRPLGHVERGTGNGTDNGTGTGAPGWGRRADGAVTATATVIGTYLHGPILARNPALADHLLTLATGCTLGPLELPDQEPMRSAYLAASGRRASLQRALNRLTADERPGKARR
jgi:lipid II isoglutaminyl synthase (glutamine-hydrolysing)